MVATEEEIEEIYQKYIYATHCELCNKQFKTTKDRHMEHNNNTGEFRNIACSKCNHLKADVKIQSNNTTGYKGICKQYNLKYKQGFIWTFQAQVNGKQKQIKNCVNKEKLIAFAEKWKKDNNYHT